MAELVRTCQDNYLPTLIRGDFNIMRNNKEKNNNRFSDRLPFLFNDAIDSFDLREIDLTGRQYSWENSLTTPTYEKLDRVLMTIEWEFKFPLVYLHASDRGVSDHTPLFLDTVSPAFLGICRPLDLSLTSLLEKIFMLKLYKFGTGQ